MLCKKQWKTPRKQQEVLLGCRLCPPAVYLLVDKTRLEHGFEHCDHHCCMAVTLFTSTGFIWANQHFP